jgi:hypothetical protein
MSTVKFIQQSGGVQLLKDGVQVVSFLARPSRIERSANGKNFYIFYGTAKYDFSTSDTININVGAGDQDISNADASTIIDNLRDNVFAFLGPLLA